MKYWKEKTVLVTGAVSGIGRATALRFAQEGASVALLDRNEQGLEETCEIIGDASRTLSLAADLLEEDAVVAALQQAIAWKGRIDVAVNVAGTVTESDFLTTSKADWDALMQVNLRGVYLVSQQMASHMIAEGGGAIVNVSSVMVYVGHDTLVSYSASKGGVSALTRALASRLAKDGIRVNAVCPGDVATPLLDAWLDSQPDPEKERADLASHYPLGYYCQPEDVAGPILFLAGPDARCITGAELMVDCGLMVKMW